MGGSPIRHGFHRRKFLGLSLAAAALPLAWRVAPFAPASGDAKLATRQLVERLFTHPDHARAVGRLVRAGAGGRPDLREEAAALEGLIDGLRPRSAARIRGALRARIRRDFAAGDVVVVEGWYLARAEAAVCFLLAS